MTIRRVSPLLAGALLALGLVAPVLGHAELISSDPDDTAVLGTPPTVITLTFSEGVVGKSSFKLLGPDGATIGTGGPVGDGPDTMTLNGLSLAPGGYTIEWTSVANDGDVQRGTLTFTVNEPASGAATPSPPPSQASAAPTASPSPAVAATPAPSRSADTTPVSSSGTDVLLPIVAALALVGGIGAVVLRRNRAA
ncbi:MAG TPA: copper resistance protein CopC [Candidatus Limnocylindrales bacterium]